MKKKLFSNLFAAMMVLSLLLSACGSGTNEATTAPDTADSAAEAETEEVVEEVVEAAPLVLKVANTANITTWDPIASFSTEAAYIANMYEQLLRINPPGSAEPFTPLLAESWESNEDGTVWTFYLREGVKFHDGEPLTAEAVKMSLELAGSTAGASFIWWPLEEITVVDDLTVEIHMSFPSPVDLIASSLYAAWIVSPKALEAAADNPDYWSMGVEAGTGPYMLESYTPDQEILLTAFEEYWGGWEDGQFDKVLVHIVPEAVIQQQMLEGGEVDLASRIPLENVDVFRNSDDYTVYEDPSFFNYVGYFNTLRAPLDNALVRKALSYAIPYDDIITVAASGAGTQSRGPVPAGVWPYSDDVSQYTYDLDMAADLLEQAGYPGGGFNIRLTYAAENNTEEAFIPLIKDSFEQIGVTVDIEPMLFSQQWEEAKSDPANAQDMFVVLYWPTYSDAGADNLWSLFHSSEAPFFNLSYWVNEEFDTLVDDAIAMTVSDAVTSQAKYIEAMNLLVEEAPGVFFFDTMSVLVVPDYIEGFQYNLNYPFVYHFYYDLHLAQ